MVKSLKVKRGIVTGPWAPVEKNSNARIPETCDYVNVANREKIELYLQMFLEKDGWTRAL